MAKSDTQVAKITPGALAPRPTHIEKDPIVGQDQLKQFVVVPRLKVVQKQSAAETLAKFRAGDFILSPLGLPIAVQDPAERELMKTGQPVLFTPIYFYVDWATWNPISLKGELPAIAHRTADERDPIVAKSRDRNLRKEPLKDQSGNVRMGRDGQPLFVRHVEHLNFVVLPYGLEQVTDPFILSFSRGEHWSGSQFCGLIRARKANMFGCKFAMRSQLRPPRNGGDWYGIDVMNPADAGLKESQWVDDQTGYAAMKELNAEWAELKRSRGIQADMSDTDDIVDPEEAATQFVDPATREM
jgi:hypothetical protein